MRPTLYINEGDYIQTFFNINEDDDNEEIKNLYSINNISYERAKVLKILKIYDNYIKCKVSYPEDNKSEQHDILLYDDNFNIAISGYDEKVHKPGNDMILLPSSWKFDNNQTTILFQKVQELDIELEEYKQLLTNKNDGIISFTNILPWFFYGLGIGYLLGSQRLLRCLHYYYI